MANPSKRRKISEEEEEGEEEQEGKYADHILPWGEGDMTIEVGSCKWRVYKGLLQRNSEYFNAALQEGKWKEGQDNYMKLSEENPIMFARCLQFLRCGTYGHYVRDDKDPLGDPFDPKLGLKHFVYTDVELGGVWYPDDIFDEDMPYSLTYDWRISDHIRWENEKKARLFKQDAYRYIPKTQKQTDIILDMQKYDRFGGGLQGTDLAMYVLADKYLIPSLRKYALESFKRGIQPQRNRRVPYATIYRAVSASKADLNWLDEQLRRWLARHIAIDYQAIRAGDNKTARGVKHWFQQDGDFALMIMDHLARVKYE